MGAIKKIITIQESLMMSERPPIRSNSLDSFSSSQIVIDEEHSRTSPQVIINNGRWITSATFNASFQLGQINIIDKRFCGTGYSTMAMKSRPPRGMFNILILPNVYAVSSKESKYREKPFRYENGDIIKIAFVYGEGIDKQIPVSEYGVEYDTIVIVADSFLKRKTTILNRYKRINFLLIDEEHSQERGSQHRKSLKGFHRNLEEYVNDFRIATVTATPNYGVVPTHIIEYSGYSDDLHIKMSHNFIETTTEANKRLSDGDDYVLLATNDIHTIKACIPKSWGKVLKIKELNAGATLTLSLCENYTIDINPNHKLYIYSSKGYEGGDLDKTTHPHVYFFEDLSKAHTTFSIGNAYQLFKRPRGGALSYNWCRATKSETKGKDVVIPVDKVQKYIDNKSIPNSKKEKSKAIYKDYIHFIPKEGEANKELVVNKVAINLHNGDVVQNDHLQKLIESEPYHKKFVEDRNITFDFTEANAVKRLKRPTTIGNDIAVEMLLSNAEFIYQRGIVDDDNFKMSLNIKTGYGATIEGFRKALVKSIEQGHRRWNYDGEATIADTEMNAYNLLKDAETFRDFADKMKQKRIKLLREWKRNKEISRQDYETEMNKLDNKFPLHILEVLGGLAINKSYFKSEQTMWRDYGVITKLSIDTISDIVQATMGEFIEIDIKSEFPKLLHIRAGFEFPEDFYERDRTTTRRERKISVNAALNNSWYNIEKATSKTDQRINKKKRLVDLGFAEEVAEYIMDLAFDYEANKVFNELSMEEYYIINKLIDKIKRRFGIDSNIHRRHDSIVIFNMDSLLGGLDEFVKEIEHKGYRDWFKITRYFT